MRKLAKGICGVILLSVLAGVIFLFLFWSRVPDMIASQLSKRLQTRVEIEDIKLSFSNLTVDRFEIYNPRGYNIPKAFSTQKIIIEVPPTHFLRDEIVIDDIIVSDVYIGLEFDSPKSTRGNWTTLLKNAQDAQEESSKSASDKSVFIKRLLLTNIQAELYYQSDGKLRKLKPIKQIELRNISSKGGDIGDQLMNSALGQAVKQIFIEENLKDILDQFLQSPTNPVQEYLGPLKNLFNALPKAPESEEALAKVF